MNKFAKSFKYTFLDEAYAVTLVTQITKFTGTTDIGGAT